MDKFACPLAVGCKGCPGPPEAALYVCNLASRVVAVNAINFNNMTGGVGEPRISGVQWRASD